jgi:hypothetical protein
MKKMKRGDGETIQTGDNAMRKAGGDERTGEKIMKREDDEDNEERR